MPKPFDGASRFAAQSDFRISRVEEVARMIMQVVHLKSPLSEGELLSKARERAPEFRALPGLLQKYYLSRPGEGEYAGVYIWDSKESLAAFRESELAQSIAVAYQVSEPPDIEISEVLFPLREM